ncbi:helix-turn-helix domain-containing protein [Bartonella sp. HY406]|uniref:helix-turn-helix domain-containing protein n=1 Tax=Bartonella sp. HY406 TaxID=2979331 RepID=UPI0021C83326|nr:helix-turn-helix transcriptional regulator [Bartonella sp. HY406]UXN05105.1 helix-turn-helix transcriptional regulator [Bartonella sp. HY406]
MKNQNLPSFRARSELIKLGSDIAIARKKRKMTQKRLADGAGVNVETIRRLEKGQAGISIGVLAMVLITLGEPNRLGKMLDMASDDIGLVHDANRLPKRIRSLNSKKRNLEQLEAPQNTMQDNGEAF